MPDDDAFSQLVVVGSSAGGIEALSKLLTGIPESFPAPLVIAQHLDPKRVSHLREILSRHSNLPVRTVERDELLEPGTVYVVPADRNVEITNHHVRVIRDSSARIKPSINLLLSSAAEVFGEGLIAVILTGTGSDGAAGAFAVKSAGGTVLIQNPQTASFPALPLSLAPTTVDVVANLEDMGKILSDLLTGIYAPAEPDEARALASLLSLMRERLGINFSRYKEPTIMRRLKRRMMATGQESVSRYSRYLAQHPEEYQRLVSSFLIKVTGFFRDVALFAYLREHVLPDLIEDARKHGDEVRIWSAGCATGEEAYSLAILMSELLGDELESFHVRIFATDLDNDAIDFARRGIYPASAIEQVPPELVERHFTEIDGEYHVVKAMRSIVVFGQHDLGERAPFLRIDLMLCRNVLIYFTPELQRHVLQLAAFSLRDGGYLVLGKAETVSPLAEYFVPDEQSLRIYRRRGDRSVLMPARIREALPSTPGVPGASQVLAHQRVGRYLQESRRPSARERAEAVLLKLPVGIVVINENYDIEMINSAARDLLGIHSAAIGDDFIHLAQSIPSKPLRAAIDAALRGEQGLIMDEVSTGEALGSEEQWVRLAFQLVPSGSSEAETRAVSIVITDVSGVAQQRRRLEGQVAGETAELTRIRHQVQRLTDINRELHDANVELTNANRELRSANDEFLVGNEELQAASEEVETLNEELQATNEELETLNEELQATIEELNTTNDDLQARSVELQDLAVSLESERGAAETERARLAAILVSMADAVVALDSNGNVVVTNEAYEHMFGGANRPATIEDPEGQPLPADQWPSQRAMRGESFTMEFSASRSDGSRGQFEALGQPTVRDGKFEGGVVVIRDITDRSIHRMQDVFLAAASHELRTPLSVLTGYLSMMERAAAKRESLDTERVAGYLRLALEQARRMEGLMYSLLDVARLQAGKLTVRTEPIDLVPVVDRTVEAARQLSRGPEICLDMPPRARNAGLMVDGDELRLEQVLLNVLVNAVTYAHASKRVEVHVRRARGAAELRVRDYGPGIPAEALPEVFSRFYTVEHHDRDRHGGLGLGLYLSREIVTLHGGTIDIDSTEGKGTTVTMTIPLKK